MFEQKQNTSKGILKALETFLYPLLIAIEVTLQNQSTLSVNLVVGARKQEQF